MSCFESKSQRIKTFSYIIQRIPPDIVTSRVKANPISRGCSGGRCPVYNYVDVNHFFLSLFLLDPVKPQMNRINKYPCLLIHTCCFLPKSSVWECRKTCQSWNMILECKIAKMILKKVALSTLKVVNRVPLSNRLSLDRIQDMKVLDGSIYIVADHCLCVVSHCCIRQKVEGIVGNI